MKILSFGSETRKFQIFGLKDLEHYLSHNNNFDSFWKNSGFLRSVFLFFDFGRRKATNESHEVFFFLALRLENLVSEWSDLLFSPQTDCFWNVSMKSQLSSVLSAWNELLESLEYNNSVIPISKWDFEFRIPMLKIARTPLTSGGGGLYRGEAALRSWVSYLVLQRACIPNKAYIWRFAMLFRALDGGCSPVEITLFDAGNGMRSVQSFRKV